MLFKQMFPFAILFDDVQEHCKQSSLLSEEKQSAKVIAF